MSEHILIEGDYVYPVKIKRKRGEQYLIEILSAKKNSPSKKGYIYYVNKKDIYKKQKKGTYYNKIMGTIIFPEG